MRQIRRECQPSTSRHSRPCEPFGAGSVNGGKEVHLAAIDLEPRQLLLSHPDIHARPSDVYAKSGSAYAADFGFGRGLAGGFCHGEPAGRELGFTH